MRKKILTIIPAILAAALLLTGCGGGDDTSRPAPKITDTMPGTEAARRAPSAPTADAQVVIAGLQRDLEPAGQPLTAEQQATITEVYDPASPKDIRPVFGVLTAQQKQVLVDKIRGWLAESDHPFTAEQTARYMALGPGSEDKAPTDIVTLEQFKILVGGGQQNSQQK